MIRFWETDEVRVELHAKYEPVRDKKEYTGSHLVQILLKYVE